MLNLSQLDPRWAHKTIGNTRYTIGRWGCTITSIIMLISKVHPGVELAPPHGAQSWAFNSNGEILWNRSAFEYLKFKWRFYGAPLDQIKQFAARDDAGVILQVNGNHWVAVAGVQGGKLIIHDPIDGRVHVGLPDKYYISGGAYFEKIVKKVVLPNWQGIDEAIELAKQCGITDFSDPYGDTTKNRIEWVLHDLGVHKNVDGRLPFIEFIYGLYKLGVFQAALKIKQSSDEE